MQNLSITGKQWTLIQKPQSKNVEWARACGLPQILGQILSGRDLGLQSAEDLSNFLTPSLQHLPDPHNLPDVEKASNLLANSIIQNKKIAIFGDYDVDGSCATAVLQRYLKAVGIEPIFYIPDRMTEGYGPTPMAMQKLKEQGAELLLTVDCGSVAFEAMEEADKLGLQVIITDHHQMRVEHPPCAALINPHRLDAPEEFRMLSGAGVAFYLVLALNRNLREQGFFSGKIKEPDIRYLLDLVALSTVADVMPLTGINRILVERGLKILERTQNMGLKMLLQVAEASEGPYTPYTLGFILGPRINAGGRIGSSNLAVDVLTEETEARAYALALELDELNQKRKAIEARVQEEAVAQVIAMGDDLPAALVVWGKNWHPGVVGIVAARVKERFNRPTFVLGQDELGQWKGSARSISGLDVGKAMQKCRDAVVSGGGHAMAAGTTVEKDQIENFKQAFISAIQEQADKVENVWQASMHIDASISLSAATPELVNKLNQIAPFGPKNYEPKFVLPGVRVAYVNTVGKDQNHVKVTFENRSGEKLDAIAFKAMDSELGPYLMGKPAQVSVAGTLKNDTWGGRTRTQLIIDDAFAGTWQAD